MGNTKRKRKEREKKVKKKKTRKRGCIDVEHSFKINWKGSLTVEAVFSEMVHEVMVATVAESRIHRPPPN